jgi:hypothetical protein
MGNARWLTWCTVVLTACVPETPPRPEFISGRVVTDGPCPVGLPGTRLQVVTPSIQDPARKITELISTDGGSFLFAAPDGGFDLVAQGTEGVVIYAGLSSATRFARVELPSRGDQPVVSTTFRARLETSTPQCMNVRKLAQPAEQPGTPEVRIESDGGVFTATAWRCADDTTNEWIVDFFDTDVGDACDVRLDTWMSSGSLNVLPFPVPSNVPEMVLTGRGRGFGAQQRIVAPDGGTRSVRVVNRFGTRDLSVGADGTFDPPVGVTLEGSSANQVGLVTRTFRSGSGEIVLPAFPQPLAPPSTQPLTVGTRFEWTRTLEAPQLFVLKPVGGVGRLLVFTDATSFVLPDLKPFNVLFPAATRWEWSVFTTTLAPGTTVEQLLAAGPSRRSEYADTLIGGRELSTP